MKSIAEVVARIQFHLQSKDWPFHVATAAAWIQLSQDCQDHLWASSLGSLAVLGSTPAALPLLGSMLASLGSSQLSANNHFHLLQPSFQSFYNETLQSLPASL